MTRRRNSSRRTGSDSPACYRLASRSVRIGFLVCSPSLSATGLGAVSLHCNSRIESAANSRSVSAVFFFMSLLALSNLVKHYPSEEGGPTEIVRISKFELQAGEQVLLQGESGSGKSTLLNLIAGIVKADGGTIELSGRDMAMLSESARDAHRAKTLGYVFQNFNLLDAYSCVENVELGMAFGGKSDSDFARNLLERVGLSQRIGYRPDQLSQGQKQRVAIARALANRPKLVLADEPTGNLDPSNARVAMDLIQSLCRENEAALLLVSHDPTLKDRFERSLDLEELNEAKSKGAAL